MTRRTRAEVMTSQAAHKAALTGRILDRVKSGAMPSDTIAAKINTPKSTVREILMALMREGAVHRRRDPYGLTHRKVRWYMGPGPEIDLTQGVATPSQSTVKVYPQDYPVREPMLAALFGAGQSEQRA